MLRRLLLVDDDADVRLAIRRFLEVQGFKISEADTCSAAEGMFRSVRPDAVLLDYSLPDGDALSLLPRLKQSDDTVPVIVLTAHASIDLAVAAVKLGADHFLTKPVELPALLVVLQRSLENERSRRTEMAARKRLGRRAVNPFAGTSAAIKQLEEHARRIAESDRPVLLLGETGTGKGVLARWLHDSGPRKEEAFADLNCAALARDLIETELFGNERGAFTGAVQQKQGILEFADHGTLFLDEIGDMELQAQAKILKVIEEKHFRRVGDVRDRFVDVHIIAATHQDIPQRIAEQKFRQDLYYRISTLPLILPALRERAEDIPVLASAIVAESARELGRDVRLSDDAMAQLQSYDWPGNIRELRNVLERAVLLAHSDVITSDSLFFQRAAPSSGTLPNLGTMTLEELEAAQIRHVLAEEQGNVERSAKRLGIHRATLYQKMKALKIGRL
jgi:DNA-binding NtrC family response regulator